MKPAAEFKTVAEGVAAADNALKSDGPDAALAVLAELRERFPDEPEVVFRSAQLLKQERRLDEADRLLKDGQERFKTHFGLWIQRAWLAHERRDFTAAAERWAETREVFPDHPAGYAGAATSLREAGRNDEAEALSHTAVERFPTDFGVAAAHAEAAFTRRDFTEAANRWQQTIDRFPDHPSACRGHALALREARRFDEAEATLAAALARFSDNAGLLTDLAWIAQIRRNWPEAARRWREVRVRDPQQQGAYLMGAGALRASGETEEADRVLADAVARFPGNPDALIQYARLTRERGDLAEAIARYERLRAAFPDNAEGYLGGAAALSAQRRHDEAEALLAAALARFPANAQMLREHADLAARREAWDVAFQRYAQLRDRFPEEPAGYTAGAALLAHNGRVAEAEQVLKTAVQRLPDNPYVALEYAKLPTHPFAEAVDPDEALSRLARIRERFPEFEPAYGTATRILREAHRPDEAEVIAGDAQNRFSASLEPVLEQARIALEREDWDGATSRFTRVTEAFPNEPHGYVGLAQALSRGGRFDDADSVLRYAMARFPGEMAPFAEYGLVAIRRNDWKSALERTLAAQQRFPNDAGLKHRVFEARMRLAETDPAAADSDSTDAVTEAETNDPRALVMRFESLGGSGHGCEFGLVQRKFGAEPLGLLRWADLGTDAEGLIAALESDFAGVGEAEHLELITVPVGGRNEYWTRDRRYWMAMHAFIFEDEIPYDKMLAQACRRLQYLRRKLIDDLREGSKIFVYKNMFRNLNEDELTRLHAAMRRYGDNTLLYVRFADADHPNGTVEAAAPGLLVGYIERFAFSPEDKPQGDATLSWPALCREALRITAEGAVPLRREPALAS